VKWRFHHPVLIHACHGEVLRPAITIVSQRTWSTRLNVGICYLTISAKTILTLEQSCSTFHVAQATSAKFGLHKGKMKFNRQEK